MKDDSDPEYDPDEEADRVESEPLYLTATPLRKMRKAKPARR
jgi:hypothetical protein